MVRTLLRRSLSITMVDMQIYDVLTHTPLGGMNDLSPSLRLGDEGIDSILLTLQGLRDRVLSMFILP
jgi:hypothetical protein